MLRVARGVDLALSASRYRTGTAIVVVDNVLIDGGRVTLRLNYRPLDASRVTLVEAVRGSVAMFESVVVELTRAEVRVCI